MLGKVMWQELSPEFRHYHNWDNWILQKVTTTWVDRNNEETTRLIQYRLCKTCNFREERKLRNN